MLVRNHKDEFIKALAHVKVLKEYKAYEKDVLAAGFKVVTYEDAPFAEKTLIDQHCYWSITVHEEHPDHVYLWGLFYVSLNGKRIWVAGTEGELFSLKQWRARNKKWERERQKQEKETPKNQSDIVIQESPDMEPETQEN